MHLIKIVDVHQNTHEGLRVIAKRNVRPSIELPAQFAVFPAQAGPKVLWHP
jgi:hypothetical protein